MYFLDPSQAKVYQTWLNDLPKLLFPCGDLLDHAENDPQQESDANQVDHCYFSNLPIGSRSRHVKVVSCDTLHGHKHQSHQQETNVSETGLERSL